MTRHVLLNNIAHKDLRVKTHYSPDFGDNVNSVVTFPTEFGDMQREYPILFKRNTDTGEFQSIALLGFAKNENLFLDAGAWKASYVPAIIARGPFLIGFQEQEHDGQIKKESVIHVDLDSPRISQSEGEAVFLRHGGNSPYIERIATILRGIHEGIEISKQMFAEFATAELIEPVNIDIEVFEKEQYSLSGYYTISEERLAALDGDSLERLNRSGFLQAAFLVLASLNNMKKLIDMKNKRRVYA